MWLGPSDRGGYYLEIRSEMYQEAKSCRTVFLQGPNAQATPKAKYQVNPNFRVGGWASVFSEALECFQSAARFEKH